jgi:hypothetical protein
MFLFLINPPCENIPKRFIKIFTGITPTLPSPLRMGRGNNSPEVMFSIYHPESFFPTTILGLNRFFIAFFAAIRYTLI